MGQDLWRAARPLLLLQLAYLSFYKETCASLQEIQTRTHKGLSFLRQFGLWVESPEIKELMIKLCFDYLFH